MNIVVVSPRSFVGKNLTEFIRHENVLDREIKLFTTTANEMQWDLRQLKEPYSLVFLSTVRREAAMDGIEIFHKNIALTEKLLRSVKDTPVSHVVFASSICVYGRPPELPITIKTSPNPTDYYGLSKYVSERMLELELKCPLTVLRLPGIYGPYDEQRSIVGKFMKKILANQTIEIPGAGKQLRDFLYVGDLTRIIFRMVKENINGTYNIASNKPRQLKDLILSLEIALKKNAVVNYTDVPDFSIFFDAQCPIKNFGFTDPEKGIWEYVKHEARIA